MREMQRKVGGMPAGSKRLPRALSRSALRTRVRNALGIGLALPALLVLHGSTLRAAGAGEASSDPGSARGSGSSLFFSRPGLVLLGGLGMAAAVASRNENPERMARLIDRAGLDLLVDAGDEYGDGVVMGISAAGLLLAAHALDSPGMKQAGSDVARSLLWSGTLVWSLKLAINAERPDGGRHSFPSGHTASAFSLVPVILKHGGWKPGAGALALAAGTALGRMEDRRHYLADVLAGAALGLAVGLAVAQEDGEGLGGLAGILKPFSLSPEGVGLTISF